jgi:DNA-binding Xre family transcriptional regulator
VENESLFHPLSDSKSISGAALLKLEDGNSKSSRTEKLLKINETAVIW